MRVFVTGVNGQLGHDAVNELIRRGHTAVGSDLTEAYAGLADGSAVASASYVQLDITDSAAVRSRIASLRPDAVIHCAAWTDVDAAEDPENRAAVWAINVEGTGTLAESAREVGAGMLYVSTDYVFDGRGTRPWQPEDTCFAPLNVYGRSKLEGERAAAATLERLFIVRTSWVFGSSGRNFVRTMIRAGKTHKTVRVVNDQIGTPTYTRDLARLLADLIESGKYGCYHASNEGGYISWYDFCCEIYRQCGLQTAVLPVTTAEYDLSAARRPLNSRLDKTKLLRQGFRPLPDWRDALARYLKEEQF